MRFSGIQIVVELPGGIFLIVSLYCKQTTDVFQTSHNVQKKRHVAFIFLYHFHQKKGKEKKKKHWTFCRQHLIISFRKTCDHCSRQKQTIKNVMMTEVSYCFFTKTTNNSTQSYNQDFFIDVLLLSQLTPAVVPTLVTGWR